MWRSVLCAAVLSSSQVTGTTEEGEAMKGEEESSCLLSSKARKIDAQPLHSQQNHDPANPALLRASVQSMAHRLAGSKEAPPEIYDELQAIQTALATMTPRLEEEHTSAQGRIQEQLAEIEACHSNAEHGASVTDGLADELAVMTTCMDEQAAAESTQQQKCDEWNTHASRLSFPSTSESSSASSEARYELYQTLKGWVDDHGPTIESQRTECNVATTFAVAEAERCEPIIAQYDTMFCQHALSCTLLSACHHHEVDVYQNLISDSSAGMTSRQNQHRVILQVQCISDLITNAMSSNTTIGESSLDECDGEADVSHLSLSFPDPPPVLPECPPPQGGDPHCPAVDLPEAWQNGEAMEIVPAGPRMIKCVETHERGGGSWFEVGSFRTIEQGLEGCRRRGADYLSAECPQGPGLTYEGWCLRQDAFDRGPTVPDCECHNDRCSSACSSVVMDFPRGGGWRGAVYAVN